ncbi:OB-fold domain-containing protein [Phenylobacterium sp.]|uniref:Zn-ribbon domain-containing OB-fold protein n=1 Tax=Phenylobacterium sp. TaxID=1871053 RepID=UPI00301CD952
MEEEKKASPTPRPLFQEAGTGALPDHPALFGGRCENCGFMFFPMQKYGCESCGSVKLTECVLTGRGKILTLAKVHEHKGPGREAPFTVAAVQLDDGPMVRALLDAATADETKYGDTVVTKLIPETRPNRGPYDLRFTRQAS